MISVSSSAASSKPGRGARPVGLLVGYRAGESNHGRGRLDRRGLRRCRREDHRRARCESRGRLQSDLAATCRRLQAQRAVPERRPRARSRLRRRPQLPPARAAGDDRRRHRPRRPRGPGARDGRRRHARSALRRRAVRLGPLGSVARARTRIRSGCSPRWRGSSSRDGVAVFVTPNRLTLGRPDEIIDPYHYVEFDHAELGRLCERSFERGRGARPLRLAAVHGDLRRGAGHARQAPRPRPAAAAAARPDEGEAAALRRDASPPSRTTTIRGRRRSPPMTSSCATRTSRPLSTSAPICRTPRR